MKPENKKYMDGQTRKRNLWFDTLISYSMWLHHPKWGAQELNFPQISETGVCIHFHPHFSAYKQSDSSTCHGTYYPALNMGMSRPHHFHLIACQCCWSITADFTNVVTTLSQSELIIQAKGCTRPKYMC